MAAGQAPTVIHQAIIQAPPAWGEVDILPSDRLLASRQEDISIGRESRLRTALSAVADDYEHIVIDCPPNLGVLTTNALVAADSALIVTTSRESSVDGVSEMVTTIASVRSYYNPQLSLAGILLNQHPAKTVFDARRRNGENSFKNSFTHLFLPDYIAEREYVAHAATNHRPFAANGKDHGIDLAFDRLVHALLPVEEVVR